MSALFKLIPLDSVVGEMTVQRLSNPTRFQRISYAISPPEVLDADHTCSSHYLGIATKPHKALDLIYFAENPEEQANHPHLIKNHNRGKGLLLEIVEHEGETAVITAIKKTAGLPDKQMRLWLAAAQIRFDLPKTAPAVTEFLSKPQEGVSSSF